jgi:hypothetical protein
MPKRLRYILALLILGMLVAPAAWKYAFRKSESSVASRKTDITIEASFLLQAFESNEDSANALYLDKKSFDPALVNPGSRTFIKGICTGYLMDVVLNKCSIVGQTGN